MSEENKTIILRWYDSFTSDKMPDFDLLAPDVINHMQEPGLPSGREGVKARMELWAKSFSDWHITAEDVIAEGDKVAVRSSWRARHTGEFLGVPATGREVTLISLEIMRIRNGKIAEHWDLWDMVGMMQQLGIVVKGVTGS